MPRFVMDADRWSRFELQQRDVEPFPLGNQPLVFDFQ